LITKTLKEFEELLKDHSFFRIHRSYLINLRRIKSYLRTQATDTFDGDGGCVVMDNNAKLPVSRDKRKVLLGLFSQPF
jgi:two-component system LytT family response regulator